MATRADIKTAILGLLPDNLIQDIEPLDERDSFDLVIDNFLNIDDNLVTNGLTLDGVSGSFKLGGSLIENTTIEGSGLYSLNVGTVANPLTNVSFETNNAFNLNASNTFAGASSQLFAFAGGSALRSYDGLNQTGNLTSLEVSDPFGNGGVLITDSIKNEGARYAADYSANYVALSLTHKGYQDGHIASVTASALAQAPAIGQDGFALVYDHGSTSYTLASVGGGGAVPITAGVIPTGTGSSISDSKLSSTFSEGLLNTTSLIWSNGLVDTNQLFVFSGDEAGGSALIKHTQKRSTTTANVVPSLSQSLESGGTNYVQAKNVQYSSLAADYHVFTMPQGGSASVQYLNFWSSEVGTGATWNTTFGGFDYQGHAYGVRTDPRPTGTGNTESFTWICDNNQHFVIGNLQGGNTNSSGALNALNAHLIINSRSDSPTPEPHLRFQGSFDSTSGVVDGNIWRDLDGNNYARENGTIKRLTNDAVTESIVQASWSGNTSYQYAVSFTGAKVGEFFQVLPDEDVFAAVNLAGSEWNGYAYCAVDGTVIVVCRITSFVNIPASSIFTVKKIN